MDHAESEKDKKKKKRMGKERELRKSSDALCHSANIPCSPASLAKGSSGQAAGQPEAAGPAPYLPLPSPAQLVPRKGSSPLVTAGQALLAQASEQPWQPVTAPGPRHGEGENAAQPYLGLRLAPALKPMN